jgi:MATE family multidrug resistance protein
MGDQMSLAHADLGSERKTHADGKWRLVEEGAALLRLATPIMLIALVNMGMSVTDVLMVSAFFGTDALAAVAVGSDLYSIVFYFGAGTLVGIAPFYTAAVTQANAGERERLERVGWMTVGLLALVTVPLVWFAPVWLARFGLEPRLLEQGQGFTRAMALTLIPMLGVVLYRTVLTAAEKPKVFLKVTLAMLPLNALGNYVLMLGFGPVPALGPTGSGVSTLIVAATSLVVLVVIARRASTRASTETETAGSWDWSGMLAVLRVGVPIGVATVAEVGIFLAATLYAARLGAADVAAHTLTLRTAGVAYAVPQALLQASMVRMARAESLGDTQAGRAVVASSLWLATVCGVAIFVLLAGSAEWIAARFFDGSAAGVAAARLAVGLLILLGLTEFVIGPGSAAAGLLRGRKDTRAPMIYALIGHWAVGAPLGLYLCEVQAYGATGIWIGLAAGTLVTTILSLARLFGARPTIS